MKNDLTNETMSNNDILPLEIAMAGFNKQVENMKNNIDEIQFNDIINLADLQELMDHFYAASGLGVSLVDANNKILLKSGWQKICTHFHQKNKESSKSCAESESYFKKNLEQGKSITYKCKNGLWDVAYPIYLNEYHLATVYFGQFFYNDEIIDKKFFIAQANKYNFIVEDYLNVLKNVPIFSKEKVENLVKLFTSIIEKLAKIGDNKIIQVD